MQPVAQYGNPSAFNIQIFNMVGGGYYAVLYDGNTPIFQRRNSAGGTDIFLAGNNQQGKLDRFTSYSYNSTTKTLTLSGASDTFNGITYTRTESYRFVSNYVVEDTWTVSTNGSGSFTETNWNYYLNTPVAIWDIDNTNFGDGTSTKSLGMGIQLTTNGSIYGCVPDNRQNTRVNVEKRALASQSGIAVLWFSPGDGAAVAVTQTTPLSATQWFFKSTNTLYDFILQSQLAIAAAKGYTGSQADQVMQVTAYLNRTLFNDLTTLELIPSFFYGNSMYARDSFWHSFSLSNTDEQAVLQTWEGLQQANGNIPTYVNRDNTVSVNHDESAMLHLIRAYYDKTVRGLTVNNTVLTNILTYVTSQVVGDQYQNISGQVQHWADLYTFGAGDYDSYKQGIYCVFLKCAKALGLSVTNTQINNAITQYQSLYYSTGGYMRFVSDQTHISCDALVGESLSLFLFNQTMLTDTQVNNHLNKLFSVANTPKGMKCICAGDGSYITFGGITNGGDYQCGGSWFLYEYLAYYAAYFHNYGKNQISSYIKSRVAVEMLAEPVSHEFLQTSASLANYGSCTADRFVFSWNTVMETFNKNITFFKPKSGVVPLLTKKKRIRHNRFYS